MSISIPLFLVFVGWFGFVLVFCLSQKDQKNVRPDFEAQMDHGKPTPFTIRAADNGNLSGKCFLTVIP